MLWINPTKVDPPHKITRPLQVTYLAQDMEVLGWRGEALIGYLFAGKIQLLSGSHRCAAAALAGIQIPVRIRPYAMVWEAWGNDKLWLELMEDKDL